MGSQGVMIRKGSENLHINNVKVYVRKNSVVDTAIEEGEMIELNLIYPWASSVYVNDNEKWGPEFALTDVSDDWFGYWHSNHGDPEPYIAFNVVPENGEIDSEISLVEVTDRKDCCHDRFSEVEVSVADSEVNVVTCGVHSYQEGQVDVIYRYECPENTKAETIVISKKTEMLHVNNVKAYRKRGSAQGTGPNGH